MNKLTNLAKSHPIISFFSLALVITWSLLITVIALYQAGSVNQSDLVGGDASLHSEVGILWASPGWDDRYQVDKRRKSPVSASKRWAHLWDRVAGRSPRLRPRLMAKQSRSYRRMGAHAHHLNPDRIIACIRFLQCLQPGDQPEGISLDPGPPPGTLCLVPGRAAGFPVIHFLGVVITNLLAGKPSLYSVHFNPGILSATLITFASVFFYSGGINEEGGWRGFAQRRLQANYSPLIANLLLWAYLVVWHIPNDIFQYREGGYLLVRIGIYPFITILFGGSTTGREAASWHRRSSTHQ